MSEELIVKNDLVVSIAYTLFVDDEIADKAPENSPLVYLQGHDNIIPGLEKELAGMKVGDSKTVVVNAEDAYGEYDDDAVVELEKDLFPEDFQYQIGTALHLRDDASGQVITGYILKYDDNKVWIDLNHPMAGKTLRFEVKVVDIRPATEEEMTHGQAGGCGGHDEGCCDGCSGCSGGSGCC